MIDHSIALTEIIMDQDRRIKVYKKALEFYVNRNHWMSSTENGDDQILIAGMDFCETGDGWLVAQKALKDGDARVR